MINILICRLVKILLTAYFFMKQRVDRFYFKVNEKCHEVLLLTI